MKALISFSLVLLLALCVSSVVVPKSKVNKEKDNENKDQQNEESKDSGSARFGQFFVATEDEHQELNDPSQVHHESVHLAVHGAHGIKTQLDISEHHDQGSPMSGSHVPQHVHNADKEGTHTVEYLAYHEHPGHVQTTHTAYQHSPQPTFQHQQHGLFIPSVSAGGVSIGAHSSGHGHHESPSGGGHAYNGHSQYSDSSEYHHPESHHHGEPHHHGNHVAHRHNHNNGNSQLKRVLIPLAGIALLGAAAALATNPVLLQLGVVSGKRRRRSAAATKELRDIPNLKLADLLEEESRVPTTEDDDDDNESEEDEDSVLDFGNFTENAEKESELGLRVREVKVLQKFLKAQANEPERRSGMTGPADGALASLLTCSGLMNARTSVCLQRMACEAHSEETNLPELEMEVIKIVLREMMTHDAIPSEVKQRVNNAMSAGSKGHRCDAIYRCPAKAWARCTEPPPPTKKPFRRPTRP